MLGPEKRIETNASRPLDLPTNQNPGVLLKEIPYYVIDIVSWSTNTASSTMSSKNTTGRAVEYPLQI